MENKTIDNNKTIRVMELTILENRHYSEGRKIRLVKPSIGMRGVFQLDSSCWYETRVYGNHINKLVGFSLDLFNRSSVRLGWRPSSEEGMFEILIYIHYRGKWIRSSREHDDIIKVVGTVSKVKEIDYKAMYQRDSVLLHALMDSIVVLRTMINARENVVVEIPKPKSIPRLSVSSSNEFNEFLMTRYKDSIQ